MSETGDYLRGIFNGEIPVKRKNPQTGKTIQIPAKKVVRFKAGAELEGQL